MSKLHELLAVESNLRSQAEATRADLKNTFEKKKHHFTEKKVTFRPLDESLPNKVEEQLSLQTTVAKELKWIGDIMAKAIDTAHQIDVANTVARADVILSDGKVLLTNIPATSLLQLEKRLRETQELIATIPTLDPAQSFQPDDDRGDGIFRARDVEKPRTSKQFDFVVMVAPTDKHPAQVKELNIDKVVGSTLTQEWSSMITVAAKGEMLERVEDLTRAVKKARARANEVAVDVKSDKIAATMLNYVFGI